MKEKIISLVLVLCFILSVWLIMTGQKSISAAGLMQEIAGLAGILVILFAYNRKYR